MCRPSRSVGAPRKTKPISEGWTMARPSRSSRHVTCPSSTSIAATFRPSGEATLTCAAAGTARLAHMTHEAIDAFNVTNPPLGYRLRDPDRVLRLRARHRPAGAPVREEQRRLLPVGPLDTRLD